MRTFTRKSRKTSHFSPYFIKRLSQWLVLSTALTLASVEVSNAAALTWDPNADGGVTGGSGNWIDAGTTWFNGGAATWSNANPDSAIFGGTGGGPFTVTVDATNITAGGVTFNTAGYTIAGPGTLTLLAATPTITALADATISAKLAGTTGFTLGTTSTNALTLTGDNSVGLSGAISILGGTLKISADNTLGAAASGVTISNGATLSVTGGLPVASARAITLGAGGGVINVSGVGTSFSDSSALTATTNSLTKTGNGVLALSTLSARTGTTAVNDGALTVTNLGALGTGAVTVTGAASVYEINTAAGNSAQVINANNGGTFQWTQNAQLTLVPAINFTGTGGTIFVGGAGASGKVLAGTGLVTSVGGSIMTKTGGGVLQLAGANAGFLGDVSIQAGTVEFQNVDSLGTVARTVTVGGTGDFATGGVANRNNIILNAGGTVSGNNAGADYTGVISVAGNANIALRQFQAVGTANSFKISGSLSGASNLSVAAPAAATLTLTGNNTGYSGNISVGTNVTVLATAKQAVGTGGYTLAGGTLRLAGVANAVGSTAGVNGVNGSYFNFGTGEGITIGSITGVGGTPSQKFALDQLYLSPRVFSRTDSTINIPNSGSGTHPIIPVAGYTVATGAAGSSNNGGMWKGLVNITTAGSYTFTSASDDNSGVWIDGILVVNADTTAGKGISNVTGVTTLTTGAHSIVVKFGQGTGGSAEQVSYNGPDTASATVILGSTAGTLTTGSLAATDIGPVTISASSTMDVTSDVTSATLSAGTATLTLTSATVNNYTVLGTTTFTGNPTFAATTGSLTLAGAIGGTGNVTFAGPYLSTLSGNNTFTGSTTVTGGQLSLNTTAGTALPGNLTVNAGNTNGLIANVKLLQSNQIADASAVTLTQGILDIGANSDTIANLTLTSGAILGAGGVLTVANAPTLTSGYVGAGLGGAYNLVKSGAGTVVLAGTGTYTGVTNVNGGILNARGTNALGAGGAGNETAIASGAVLQLDGGLNVGENVTLNGTGVVGDANDGALRNLGGLSSINGLATGSASTLRVDSGELVVNGALNVVGGALTKTGLGTLTFVSPAAIPAVTHLAGAIGFSGAPTFGTATVPAGLAYQFDNDPGAGVTSVTVPAGTAVIGGYAVDNAFLGKINAASTGALLLGADNSNALSFTGANVGLGAAGLVRYSGALTPNAAGYNFGGLAGQGSFAGLNELTVSSVLAGPNALNLTGGVVSLTAANTFTGTVTVTGGTLRLLNNTNLGNAANGITLNGGTLQAINNGDNTGAPLFGQFGNQVNGGGRVITVGAAGGTIDVPARQNNGNSYAFTGTNALAGAGTLTKSGLGFLFVLNPSAFTGGLTIAPNGGTVDVRSAGSLTAVGAITIGQSGLLNVDGQNGLGQPRQYAAGSGLTALTDRIAASAITLNGGAITFTSRAGTLSNAETFGAVTLGVGQSPINANSNSGGNSSSLLTFASLGRVAGGTVRFGGTTGTLGLLTANNTEFLFTAQAAAAILPFASQFGTNFVAYNTGTGIINPTYIGTSVPGSFLAANLVDETADVTLTAGNNEVNGFRMSGAATRNLLFTAATDTLFVTSGGTISDGNNNARNIGSAATRGVLTAGPLTANAAPRELFLHNNANTLTVFSSIVDNNSQAVTVTKDLDGTVVLDSPTNTYSGGTFVTRGTLTANNTGGLGTGAVTVKNAVVNIGNKGSSTGAVVAATAPVYTLTDQAQIVLTNSTAGAAGQYNSAGDRFSIGTGSSIYANSPGATFGFNSLTRVATNASFSAGGQIFFAPGAIVKHNLTNAPDQGTGILTIQNLGTNADLFFAPGTNGGINQTLTVGAGTPWAGLSSDRGNLNWNQGTIFANSDFTLQGLTRDGGLSILTLGLTNTTGGFDIVNNSGGAINARIVGNVAISEDAPVTMPSNLTFVVTPGALFQPNTTAAMGFGSSQAKIVVQAGGTLDPGSFVQLGAAVNSNVTATPTGTTPNGTQNLPYAVPSPVNGGLVVEAGGRFLINDASGIGSAPVGSYVLRADSILELGSANAFYGRGNMPFNLSGPVDTTGVINPGQFVYETGVITRISADNVYKLSQFVSTSQPVIEIFAANRLLTNQNNPFIIPVIGTATIAPEDFTVSNGTILTNDDADRQVNEGRGHLILGNGAILAATTQTYLNLGESLDVQAGATITIGSTKWIDGNPKLGAVQLTGPNSNLIPASATFNMLDGTQIAFGAVNVWPDATPVNLALAVTAFPSAGALALQPGTGNSLLLNVANFTEVIGPLTGNGAVIANQGGTLLATGWGAAADFASNVVFKSTNGQNVNVMKTGATVMTLTGISDSAGDFAVQQGEVVVSGTGQTKFSVRAQKGGKFTVDYAGAAVAHLGNAGFLIPAGGAFEFKGTGTAVNEAVQNLAISTGALAGQTQNPGLTTLNLTTGAANLSLTVNAIENFQSGGLSLQRSGTWLLRGGAIGNAPGSYATNGLYTPNVGNSLNGVVLVNQPNLAGGIGAFGLGAGGLTIGAAGSAVAPTLPLVLGDTNAAGNGSGFVTVDGILIGGALAITSNTITGVTNTSNLVVGQTIVGANIPANTTITAIGAGTITMSANSTNAAAVTGQGFAISGAGSYLRLLDPVKEYSATLRDNASDALNVKLAAGTTASSGDTRIGTLTLTPGSTLNISGSLPLGASASRVHLNAGGVFVQGGGAAVIDGGANNFLQANTGSSLFLHTVGDLTLNAKAMSDQAVVKTGAGTLNVGSGAFSVFRGSFQMDAGVVNLGTNNSFSNIRSGTGSTSNNNLFLNGGTLNLNGNSELISLLNSSSELPGAGGTVTSTTAATITNLGGGRFSGTIGGSISLDKVGNNTLLLTNANGYTGSTLIRGGTLQLRDSAVLSGTTSVTVQDATLQFDNGYLSNVADRIPATVPVTLRGGTINLTGAAGQLATQTINTVTLGGGTANFTSNAGGSGANELNIGNLIRVGGAGSLGSSVNFQQNYGFLGTAGNTTTAIRNFITNLNGSALTLNDNIVAGWAVVGGSNFATYQASRGIGAMGNTADGFANYDSTDITAATATQNVNDNGTARTLAANKTINALRTVPTAAATYTINSGVGLTLDTGGLIHDAGFTLGFNAAAATTGQSITSNSGELDAWINQNTVGINVPIIGAIDLVKSGGGALNLRPEGGSYTVTNTSGTNLITSAITAGLVVGMPVSGAGIPLGSTITAITPATSFTISNNTTAAVTGVIPLLGNSYTGKTFVNAGGTVTLNAGAQGAAGYRTIPGDLIINGVAVVTEANVPNQINPASNITLSGGGRLNLVSLASTTEVLNSLTFLDGSGTNTTLGLDRTAQQNTSVVNFTAPTAITANNTNPTAGVPFIGGFIGSVGFTPSSGASTLLINSPVTSTGVLAVGLRFDGAIGAVPAAVPATTTADGGLIKAGTGLLAITTGQTQANTATTITSGSNSILTASTTGLFVGMPVTGTGIPAGSFITSITANTSYTISQNATAAGSAIAVTGTMFDFNQTALTYTGVTSSLTNVFNIQTGVVRADVPGALGANSANTTVQSGAVLLGGAAVTITGSIKLNDGSTLGATINNPTLGNATSVAANQSVLNVPSGNVTIASYDYYVPGTDTRVITINGRLTGAGNINLTGTQITQGPGNGGVIAFGNPILTGTGSTDYSGTITVGANAILLNQVALPAVTTNTRTTGNALGTATINLNGGRLRIRDDASATADVSATTVTYGNNVTLSADSYLEANRQTSTTAANNIVNLGTLTVTSGSRVLSVDSGNGYQVGFANLSGAGSLIKAGASRLNINGFTGFTGGLGLAGPQGLAVAPTFNTTTVQNLVLPTSSTVASFSLGGFYITEAAKTLNVTGAFSVNSNAGNIASNASNVGGALAVTNTTVLNVGSFANNGTVGAAGGAATITSTGSFTGTGNFVTSGQQLNLSTGAIGGGLHIAGDNTVNVNGTTHNLAGVQVQSGTLKLTPTGAAATSGTVTVFGSPASTASGTAAAIAAVSGTLNLDGTAGAITHTGSITNSGLVRASAGTTTVSGTIAGTTLGYTPGLLEGITTVPGGALDVTNARAVNPGNFGIRLEPRMLQSNAVTQQALTGHIDNDTWVYTGYVKDNDGVFSFAENIDDRAAVWIDGALVLNAANGGTSRVVSTAFSQGMTGTAPTTGSNLGTPSQNFGAGITLAGYGSGWHLIEIRMNNGAGGAGPIIGNGFNVNYGFGYKDGIAALDGADMIKPIDDGTGNLFVTPVGGKGNVQVDAGATLQVGGITLTTNLTQASAASNSLFEITGTAASDVDNLSTTGTADKARLKVTDVAGSLTVNTALTLAAGTTLKKEGAGTVKFYNGAATTGAGSNLELNQGTAEFANNALGTANITFTGNSTLRWKTANTQDVSARIQSIGTGVTASLDTQANIVTLASALSGAGSIAKEGSGTLTLTTAQLNTGSTTVNAGILALSGAGSIENSAAVNINGATAVLNISAIAAASETIGSLAGTAGAGSVVLGGKTLIAGGNNSSTSFAGGVSDTGGLTKEGTGTLTMSGANSFTGTTTVNGGTLAVSGSLSGTTTVNINAGTLLLGASNAINDAAAVNLAGGTFNTGGFSDTLGALTLTANSTIDFGAGNASELTFTTLTLGLNNLNIWNWTATNANAFTGTDTGTTGDGLRDRLLFTTLGSLTTAELSQIHFFSDAGSTGLGDGAQISFGGNQELVPVPEPTTIFGALALVGLVGYRERRRFRRTAKSATGM